MDSMNFKFQLRSPKDFSSKFLKSVLANRKSYINSDSLKSPSNNSLNISLKSEKVVGSTSQRRKRYHSQSTVPLISASAWVILDKSSSKWIFGHNDMKAREIASLTKIMTCIVCLNIIKQSQTIQMHSVISVTHRASLTAGTSADLKVGDQITIKDLLYGLMLPSGNDAAIALAEYFGDALAPMTVKPVRKFVSEMNELAKEIGMPNTHFANPHGLMHKKNLASARDVARLACYALKDQDFRDIVNTKSYIAEVRGKDGFLRFLNWKNTNKLLGKGFNGVKTGVTLSAGPCLCVSFAKEISFVIVLLNSKSMEDRWIDAKKLCDWTNNKFY